jgi:uncharacterized protein Usg
MHNDQLDFMLTLYVERHGSTHLPTYTVLLDDTVIESKSIPDVRTNNSFMVYFSANLDQGEHSIKVVYENTIEKGIMRVDNIYAGTTQGGFNCDSLVISASTTNTNVLRRSGTYQFNFTSPFFYWALSKYNLLL